MGKRGLIELTVIASRVLRGEGKQEKLAPDYSPENKPEPAVEPNPFTVHHDHSRSAGNRVAPWEAQKPPPVEQPRKVVKKKCKYRPDSLSHLPAPPYLPLNRSRLTMT